MLPASVLYGGQEGLKPLSFKMCAFQGKKTLTNRLLVVDGVGFSLSVIPLPLILLTESSVQDVVFLACHISVTSFYWGKPVWGTDSIPHRPAQVHGNLTHCGLPSLGLCQ